MTMPQLIISQNFSSPVWRMEIDQQTATILLEIRNEADKHVSFASVDLHSGKVNFKDLTTPERWLTGIEAAFNGVLLLHNYQSANGPVHKAITAVDVHTGEVLWSNYSLAFDHLSINGPIVYNTQLLPKRLYLADVKTGAMVRPYNPVIDTGAVTDVTVPDMADEMQLVALNLSVQPFSNIVQYLNHNNYRIVSLHTLNNNSLKQHLYIFDDTGHVYEYLLNEGIQKLQPEAFVLHKNWLIYLKNKTDLMVLSI